MIITEEQTNCKRVLVTDDDPDELFATARIIEKAGYQVERARSGEETIQKSIQFKPDLILLDVVMPDMDGFETCKHLKSGRQTNDIFVILLSSIKKTPEYKAKGLDAGADGFISRPFHKEEFVARIRSALRIKSVEKELRMQRQWLRITLSSIGDGLIATDAEERVLFMNPVAEKITGWTQEEAKLRGIGEVFNIVDDLTHQTIQGPISKVLKEGTIIQLDDNVLLVKKNQDQIPVADSASPIRTDDGSVIGGVLVFRDITQKKIADQAINQAQKDWEAMFRAIGQMTLIIDPNHGILDANDVALTKTGLTKEQIVGKRCFEIIHGASKPPKDCPMVVTLKSGRQESSVLPIKKIEGDYLVSCTPVLDAKGQVDKIIHIATDISALKKAEAELRESERSLKNLLKAIQAGVVVHNVEKERIVQFNPAAKRILGLNEDQILGRSTAEPGWEFVHEDGNPMLVDEYPVNIVKKTKKPLHDYIVGISKPSENLPTWALVNATPQFNKEGKLSDIIVSSMDISELKKTQSQLSEKTKQLMQAQKLESIGNLAGGIAHDFNNILSSVIGFTELAIDEVQKGTTLEDSLQEVYSAGKRAKELVRQILAFARQSDEKTRPVRPSLIAKEVLSFIRHTLPTTIEVRQDIGSDSLIIGNETQIYQLFMNLCTNAAHSMDDSGGVLEIHMKDTVLGREQLSIGMKQGEYIEIRVSDTGMGIAPDIIDSIFHPYFTTKGPGEGTGMGLSMVNGIVDSYGGKITVDSQLGKGSTFTIYLPIAKKRSAQDVYVPEELPMGTERILFVDDEVPIAKMGSQILERLGYTVTTRTSSVDVLELFQNKPDDFDLVVTDMTMPNMTGDKLAVELMKIRPDIPVVLFTGYSNKHSEETASKIGIKAFAYKPIVKEDLAKTVRKVLDEAKS